MPLQLRRGTEAERTSELLNTPPLADGEPLWITDTGQLYIGDGETPLAELEAVNTGLISLDGTITSNVVPADDQEYNLGSANNRFKDLHLGGELFLNNPVDLPVGSSINGQPIGPGGSGVIEGGTYQINIIGEDSTIIVDSVNSSINAPGGITGDLSGNLSGSVLSDDGSTLIVNSFNGSINAPGGITGDLSGNLSGSVLSDDGSTIIVNSLNGIITATNLKSDSIESDFIKVTSVNTTNFLADNIDDIIGNFSIYVGDVQTTDLNTTLIFNSSTADPAIQIRTVEGSLGEISKLSFLSFGESLANPSPVTEPGGYVGSFSFEVFEPNVGSRLPVALFSVTTDPSGIVDETTANGKIIINTAGTLSGSPILRFLTFDSKGQLAVNQENAQATLDVNGFAKLSILSLAPEPPSDGMIAIADGVGWDPLGLGAPAKQQMVVYLGGNWVSIASAT